MADRPLERRAAASEVGVDDGGRRVGHAGGCRRRASPRPDRAVLSRLGRHALEGRRRDRRQVVWSRSISEYNGIPELDLAHEPVLRARHDLRRRSERQHDGRRRRRPATCCWITELDPNPNTIVTTSPVVLGNRLYIATSSSGGGVAREMFRGSMIALDIRTGRIVWQTFVLPDNGGVPGGFAGGAFVNPPAIDRRERPGLRRGRPALFAAGDGHRVPGGRSGRLGRGVLPARRVLQLGDRVRPAHRRAALVVPRRRSGRPPARLRRRSAGVVPTVGEQLQHLGLRRRRRERVRARIHGRWRDVVGIGQKSGVYWTLDAAHRKAAVEPRSSATATIPAASSGARRSTASGSTRRSATTRTPRALHAAVWRDDHGRVVGRAQPVDRPHPLADAGSAWRRSRPRGADRGQRRPLRRLDGAHRRTDVRAQRRDRRDPVALPAGGSVVAGPAVVDGTVYWGSGYARTGGVGNDKFYAFSIDGR